MVNKKHYRIVKENTGGEVHKKGLIVKKITQGMAHTNDYIVSTKRCVGVKARLKRCQSTTNVETTLNC